MISGQKDSEEQLNLAAKVLIKSARSEEMNELIQAIKSGDAAVKESIDDKLNTLTQAVNELKIQGVAQKSAIVASDKRARLEWAILNVALVPAFHYFEGQERYQSPVLLSSIFFTFRRGVGRYIQSFSAESGLWNEEGHKKLQILLTDRIKDLLGVTPRFEKEDGKWAVWYK
jgi:hypothetical protein